MRRPAPEVHVGGMLAAGVLYLFASCALLLATVLTAAAATGPVNLEAADLGAVLPTHSVEVEASAGELRVAATGEALERFAPRLAELAAAGMEPPAAVLRVEGGMGLEDIGSALDRLRRAGFRQVYLALPAGD